MPLALRAFSAPPKTRRLLGVSYSREQVKEEKQIVVLMISKKSFTLVVFERSRPPTPPAPLDAPVLGPLQLSRNFFQGPGPRGRRPRGPPSSGPGLLSLAVRARLERRDLKAAMLRETLQCQRTPEWSRLIRPRVCASQVPAW